MGQDPSDTPTLGRAELREATLRGVRWVTLARVVAEVATLGSSVVLARLVTPSEFGVVAIALIFHAVATLLAHQGVASALVQRSELSSAHVETAVLLALVTGVLGSCAVYLTAPLLAGPLGIRIAEMVQLMCPAFALAGVTAVPTALLQRRLDFRSLTGVDIATTLFGVVLTLGLALAGLNAEAIVLGMLGRSLLSAIVLMVLAGPPLPRWHRVESREIAGFGIPAAVSSFGYQGFRNVDYAIVGAQLGMGQLGFYWRAYQLGFEYQAKISTVMQRMAFPVFSRSRDLADMRALRFRIVRVHSVVIFPLLFAFIATAPDVVPWLYGDLWRPAVVPSQILAAAAFAGPLTAGIGALVMAAGRPRALAVATWATAIAYAIVIFFAAPYGLIAVCWAVLSFQAVKFIAMHRFLIQPVVGIGVRDLRDEALPALIGGLVVLGVAASTGEALGALGASAPVRAFVAAAAGGAAYVQTLRRWFPGAWADVSLLASRVLPTARFGRPMLARLALRRAG